MLGNRRRVSGDVLLVAAGERPGGPSLRAPPSAADAPADESARKMDFFRKQQRWGLLSSCRDELHDCHGRLDAGIDAGGAVYIRAAGQTQAAHLPDLS